MKQVYLAAAVLVGLGLVGQGYADEKNACESANCTLVTLSGEAHRQVAQDRLQGTLSIQAEAGTASAAQAALNAKMQDAKPVYDAAVSKAGHDGLKVSTGGYQVYQQQDGDQKAPHKVWKASQQLVLDGNDKETVLGLVNHLQGMGFAVENLNYYLSREGQIALQNELNGEALQDIQQRAQSMAKTLGLTQMHIAKVDANGGVSQPGVRPMMMRAMMAKAEAPAPVVEAGTSDVTVNLTAEVILK